MPNNYPVGQDRGNETAAAKGLTVVLPRKTEVFIDIDGKALYDLFLSRCDLLKDFYPEMKIRRKSKSPSGKAYHYHIVIDVGEPLTEKERLTIQAIMGSDPKRELISIQRLQRGQKDVSRFFENPDFEKKSSRSKKSVSVSEDDSLPF